MVKVKVIFDYDATQPDELTIKVGDIINDVIKQAGGWWEGSLSGKKGVFPDNFVEDYNAPNELPKGPKPGGGKVSDVQNKIGGQIKMGPPPQSKPTAKPKQMAVVLFEYRPEQPDELELMEGEEVEVVRMAEEGWWEGVLRGKAGMFPSNFVKLMDTPAAVVSGSSGSLPNAYPLPGVAPQNDIGHRAPPGPGGRPPAEKPKMALPPAGNEASVPPPQLPKRNRGVKARVIYSYHAQNDDELSLQEGQLIIVTDQKLEDPGWWRGELHGKAGVFPDNFVEVIPEEETIQPPPGPLQQQSARAAAPREAGLRVNKPPPQPPQEEQPARLPPRPVPGGSAKLDDVNRATGMAMPKPKAEPEITPKALPLALTNGLDDKAAMLLREEIDKMKMNMVTRESYELLQRELRASKEALDTYKRESNKKMLDLMKEIDDEKKQSTQNTIELARIRKLVEDKWS